MVDLYVNVYAVGQAYGGPEEGGWWYGVGSPVASIPVERTENDARYAMREQGFTDEQIDLYWDEHTRYGDPGWLNVDQERFGKVLSERVRDKAERLRKRWEKRYPATGKQYSVNGGDDYSVRIEDHYAREYSNYQPWE